MLTKCHLIQLLAFTLLVLSPVLTCAANLSQSYSVVEGINNIRLTLTADNATIGGDGQFQVAPGTPIVVNYDGWLTGGSSFSIFAFGLYQDAQWSLGSGSLVQIGSGSYLAGKGFNWGRSISGTVTLTYDEPSTHRILYYFGTRSFGHKNRDAVIEAQIEINRKVIPVTMDLVPHTINPRSQGNFASVFIELPIPYSAADVKIPSIVMRTEAGSTPVIRQEKVVLADHDGNGILDLKLQFDREKLIALSAFGEQTFILEGFLIDGTFIRGEVQRTVLKIK